MTEKLLQFIWQFQYFNLSELTTVTGELIEIIYPGVLNTNQGPDFINAKVRIGKTIFAGSVELHLKTLQWFEHGHQTDANYKNVILHVVLEHNGDDSSGAPVLELNPRISTLLLEKYSVLMNTRSFIPCSRSLSLVKEITWMAWKDRLIAERLQRKSKQVFSFLEQNKHHWEEIMWWMLARNFGSKVNAEAFESMARSVPVTMLARHKSQIHQLEALLFGQAGLLNAKFKEEYPKLLQREYLFLKNKYHLNGIAGTIFFLRMRPGNFPTIRMAQLAMVIHLSDHLFSKILDSEKLADIKKVFEVTANDYWHYHYRFDELSACKQKTLGSNMIDNIIINTVIPILFAYGLYHKEEIYKSKAIRWLEEIGSESNHIIKSFAEYAVSSRSAFDSQALIELKTQYCNARHCLKCAIGNSYLKEAEK